MRTKVHQSSEERRAAIQKEIESISTDIERVRALVSHVVETVHAEGDGNAVRNAQPPQPAARVAVH